MNLHILRWGNKRAEKLYGIFGTRNHIILRWEIKDQRNYGIFGTRSHIASFLFSALYPIIRCFVLEVLYPLSENTCVNINMAERKQVTKPDIFFAPSLHCFEFMSATHYETCNMVICLLKGRIFPSVWKYYTLKQYNFNLCSSALL